MDGLSVNAGESGLRIRLKNRALNKVNVVTVLC